MKPAWWLNLFLVVSLCVAGCSGSDGSFDACGKKIKLGTKLPLPSTCDTPAPEPQAESEEFFLIPTTDRTLAEPDMAFSLSVQTLPQRVDIRTVEWNLGDGRTLSGASVSVSYSNPGFYKVGVVATAVNGTRASSDLTLQVLDANSVGATAFGLPTTPSDVSGDGTVSLVDVHMIAKQAAGIESLALETRLAADVDFSGGDATKDDVLLTAQAVLNGGSLPSAVLPAHGPPGTIVSLISPKLLNVTSVATVRIGSTLQVPLRVVRGRATLIVPRMQEGPVEIELLQDGDIETFAFAVDAEIQIASPLEEVKLFLDDFVELARRKEQLTLAEMDRRGITGESRGFLMAAITNERVMVERTADTMKSAFDQRGGAQLARAFLILARANAAGSTVPQSSLTFTSNAIAALPRVPDPFCDSDLPAVCEFKRTSLLLKQALQAVSAGCNVAVAAAGVGLIIAGVLQPEFAGVAGPPAAQAMATLLSGCTVGQIAFEVGEVYADLIAMIDVDFRLESSKHILRQSSDIAVITTSASLSSPNEICAAVSQAAGKSAVKKLIEILSRRFIKFQFGLLVLEDFEEEVSKAIAGLLFSVVEGQLPDDSELLNNTLSSLTGQFCQPGRTRIIQSQNVLSGDRLDLLLFRNDGSGTAEFTCPEFPDPAANNKYRFTASLDVCGETQTSTIELTCMPSTVTIRTGDNGSLLDDIFEVTLDGVSVLSSNTPVTSSSVMLDLAPGEYALEIFGRAAPDMIGTFFLSIQGTNLTFLEGEGFLTGTDLVPRTSKKVRFQVAVEQMP